MTSVGRKRSVVVAAMAVACAAVVVPASADEARSASVSREPVSFTVTNPMVPGSSYVVRGELVAPRTLCSRSVVLAMHGLSYGSWAWDFPLDRHRYSVAQALASRGYPVVSVDEVGYGASEGQGSPGHPNGYTLTVEAYADMTAQIVQQLRAGSYTATRRPAFSHVALMGHSAGSEIVELAAALHPGIADLLIPTAYTHEPFVDNQWLLREWTADNQRALTSDYEYFETNPSIRAADMYNLHNADPAVVAWDTRHANLTPSGEVFSLGPQPSRPLVAVITIPMLLVLAQNDALFPASNGPQELQWFAGSADKTLLVAPDDGHAFMLHRNARATVTKIGDWIARHPQQLPACA